MNNKIFLQSEKGYFGEDEHKFGGCFIPEILYPALHDLQKAYKNIFQTKGFQKELKHLYKTFVGRPTPLIYAKNASSILGNEIYLKFEGLANTGAHKINNALAQVLLAKRMKKQQVIAETGAGQHGVAVASVCAFLKIPCTIFMGATDIQRQRPNVFIMEQFGAVVVPVESGTKTLKDAVNEALRQWSKSPHEAFYVLGSALGPYPYPDIVRDSQSIIGKEIKKQIRKALSKTANTFLPDYLVACVGGGSNAIGAFSAFLEDEEVQLIGVEAGGENFAPNRHAMRLSENSEARIGVAHGFRSYFLQDKHGQIAGTHSISAGLDYAGVGPQLAHLGHIGRVKFVGASDESALEALQFFARHEGILPALESSHALAGVLELAKHEQNKIIVVNVSGRGDKDIFITAKELCAQTWRDFLESELQSVEKILKQRNKPQEEQEEKEGSQEDSQIHNEELRLALQDISHEDFAFFDSTQNDSEGGADNGAKNSTAKNTDTPKAAPSITPTDLEQEALSGADLMLQDSQDMEQDLGQDSCDVEQELESSNLQTQDSLTSLDESVLQEKFMEFGQDDSSQDDESSNAIAAIPEESLEESQEELLESPEDLLETAQESQDDRAAASEPQEGETEIDSMEVSESESAAIQEEAQEEVQGELQGELREEIQEESLIEELESDCAAQEFDQERTQSADELPNQDESQNESQNELLGETIKDSSDTLDQPAQEPNNQAEQTELTQEELATIDSAQTLDELLSPTMREDLQQDSQEDSQKEDSQEDMVLLESNGDNAQENAPNDLPDDSLSSDLAEAQQDSQEPELPQEEVAFEDKTQDEPQDEPMEAGVAETPIESPECDEAEDTQVGAIEGVNAEEGAQDDCGMEAIQEDSNLSQDEDTNEGTKSPLSRSPLHFLSPDFPLSEATQVEGDLENDIQVDDSQTSSEVAPEVLPQDSQEHDRLQEDIPQESLQESLPQDSQKESAPENRHNTARVNIQISYDSQDDESAQQESDSAPNINTEAEQISSEVAQEGENCEQEGAATQEGASDGVLEATLLEGDVQADDSQDESAIESVEASESALDDIDESVNESMSEGASANTQESANASESLIEGSLAQQLSLELHTISMSDMEALEQEGADSQDEGATEIQEIAPDCTQDTMIQSDTSHDEVICDEISQDEATQAVCQESDTQEDCATDSQEGILESLLEQEASNQANDIDESSIEDTQALEDNNAQEEGALQSLDDSQLLDTALEDSLESQALEDTAPSLAEEGAPTQEAAQDDLEQENVGQDSLDLEDSVGLEDSVNTDDESMPQVLQENEQDENASSIALESLLDFDESQSQKDEPNTELNESLPQVDLSEVDLSESDSQTADLKEADLELDIPNINTLHDDEKNNGEDKAELDLEPQDLLQDDKDSQEIATLDDSQETQSLEDLQEAAQRDSQDSLATKEDLENQDELAGQEIFEETFEEDIGGNLEETQEETLEEDPEATLEAKQQFAKELEDVLNNHIHSDEPQASEDMSTTQDPATLLDTQDDIALEDSTQEDLAQEDMLDLANDNALQEDLLQEDLVQADLGDFTQEQESVAQDTQEDSLSADFLQDDESLSDESNESQSKDFESMDIQSEESQADKIQESAMPDDLLSTDIAPLDESESAPDYASINAFDSLLGIDENAPISSGENAADTDMGDLGAMPDSLSLDIPPEDSLQDELVLPQGMFEQDLTEEAQESLEANPSENMENESLEEGAILDTMPQDEDLLTTDSQENTLKQENIASKEGIDDVDTDDLDPLSLDTTQDMLDVVEDNAPLFDMESEQDTLGIHESLPQDSENVAVSDDDFLHPHDELHELEQAVENELAGIFDGWHNEPHAHDEYLYNEDSQNTPDSENDESQEGENLAINEQDIDESMLQENTTQDDEEGAQSLELSDFEAGNLDLSNLDSSDLEVSQKEIIGESIEGAVKEAEEAILDEAAELEIAQEAAQPQEDSQKEDSQKEDSQKSDESSQRHPLNYLAPNTDRARVFRTDPELSRICGQSLKS